MKKRKILSIVGARPQFTKCAVVSRELRKAFSEKLIHTGQHYDYVMSQSFFDELDIPEPDYNLQIGGESHAKMTGKMMMKMEDIFLSEKPDIVLTYGDTDSTLAAGLTAAKMYIPLVHIEAGERIFKRKHVPEEINRIIVDHITDLNLCSTNDAITNLANEGIYNTTWVGDPMYDLFTMQQPRFLEKFNSLKTSFNLPDNYIMLTIHRVENTIGPENLTAILNGLIDADIPVVWPVHPRTQNLVDGSEDLQKLASNRLFHNIPPQPYLDFNSIMLHSGLVVSDSGGVIRESYFADKYCIVPLEKSWWQNTISAGWSKEVGSDANKLTEAILEYFNYQSSNKPAYFGDGNSALKISQALQKMEL